MKLILMGTPGFVVPIFDNLADSHEIIGVFTRAPKPAGRRMQLQKSPVHDWAEHRGLPLYTNINELKNCAEPDYIVVIAYGVILRDWVLKFPKYDCINIHPSDLPKYRGPSPIATAIYNGDKASAVCLMKITADVDAGDIFMRVPFEIYENDTTDVAEGRVGAIAANMLREYLMAPDKYPPMPQVGTPSFTKKWTGVDEIIDWTKTPEQIHNMVRAIGGRTKITGVDVKILRTEIRDGMLEIMQLQPAGKKPMDWKSFVNGARGEIKIGE
jgi:methionyl-tRNA formyltransferase